MSANIPRSDRQVGNQFADEGPNESYRIYKPGLIVASTGAHAQQQHPQQAYHHHHLLQQRPQQQLQPQTLPCLTPAQSRRQLVCHGI